ncbi:hypothetical protein [Cupriavidus sp. CuC1]|uniref:hypothetical protein n=1 Tax=Cupriavidus sp. CuC1 TaxID=3373131 RepID=UPI0037CFA02D
MQSLDVRATGGNRDVIVRTGVKYAHRHGGEFLVVPVGDVATRLKANVRSELAPGRRAMRREHAQNFSVALIAVSSEACVQV